MTITRSEVISRAQTVWGGLEKVPYSQNRLHGGYRADCSGYAAACLNTPADYGGSWGGPNTVSLVTLGLVKKIDIGDLKPGDLVGRLGAGTAGDSGHVQVFAGWLNTNPDDNGHYVYEQSGPTGSPGPHKRLYRDWHAGYQAYRYAWIADDVPARPAPAPAPAPAGLVVDGDLGSQTIARWQQVMHTPVDGVIDRQRPSLLVKAVQGHLNHHIGAGLLVDGYGIAQDGREYKTVRALQRYVGTYQDGVLSPGDSACVRAIQARLNTGWF